MLAIHDLNVSYNQMLTLKTLNLQIASGEICAVIGPSGCGKSTLLKAVAGLIPNYDGEILLKGQKISQKDHTIGLIPQNYGLLPWKTVYQNITLGLEIKGIKVSEPKIPARIDDLLNELKLMPFKKNYPGALSGGQKQRVAIARAFVLQPDLLLMDEPFSALDALTREKTHELFLNIWQKEKLTTLFITHDVEEAIILGTKIVFMSPAPGTIIKIFNNPVANLKEKRNTKEFLQLASNLRKLMKEEWV